MYINQDPEKYYQIVQKIISIDFELDLKFRTAINRLYTGFLHSYANKFNIQLGQKDCHHLVRDSIKRTNFHTIFNNFEEIRVKADYRKESVTKFDYEEALDKKDTLLERMEIFEDFDTDFIKYKDAI